MPVVRGLLCLMIMLAIPFSAGLSQIQVNNGLPGPGRNASGFPALPENANPHPNGVRLLEDADKTIDSLKRFRELNIQRQKEMASDTEKLLVLANQIKAETETAGPESLSVVELRKAELIARLARAVHDKMSASVAN